MYSDYNADGTVLPEPEVQYEDVPIQVPCQIHLKSGRVLVVKDVGAWQHTDEGYFATGQWLSTFKHVTNEGTGPEVDLLIPHGSVDYIDLDYDALEAFRKEAVDVDDGAPPTLS